MAGVVDSREKWEDVRNCPLESGQDPGLGLELYGADHDPDEGVYQGCPSSPPWFICICQCFDAVCWATGRVSAR